MSDLLSIGTPVIFTNDYGVVFDRGYVVSGYVAEDDCMYKWGYRYYLSGCDAPWMPKKPENLTVCGQAAL